MSEIIIHHYPPSPVSEKIRTGMGLKQLTWRSVEQNRLPDRPELLSMTGGFRRIPVMQIGADIYCDTQCILRELEERIPDPTFFPNNGQGMPFALSRWTDGPLFDLALRVSFAPVVASLPPELVADRARLYLGPEGDFAKEAADLPHTLAQLRAQLGWLETRLETGRPYVLGDAPGMPDLLAWFIIWFVRARYEQAAEFFMEFPLLNGWVERMEAIGHGSSSPMSPAEALAVAKSAAPTTPEHADPRDPQGLEPGMRVSIVDVGDGGETPVTGHVRAVGRDTIALTLKNSRVGEVAVHFPRVGYRVAILD
jgi:glutathione S-transferase